MEWWNYGMVGAFAARVSVTSSVDNAGLDPTASWDTSPRTAQAHRHICSKATEDCDKLNNTTAHDAAGDGGADYHQRSKTSWASLWGLSPGRTRRRTARSASAKQKSRRRAPSRFRSLPPGKTRRERAQYLDQRCQRSARALPRIASVETNPSRLTVDRDGRLLAALIASLARLRTDLGGPITTSPR